MSEIRFAIEGREITVAVHPKLPLRWAVRRALTLANATTRSVDAWECRLAIDDRVLDFEHVDCGSVMREPLIRLVSRIAEERAS
jgi:hypothetical protein